MSDLVSQTDLFTEGAAEPSAEQFERRKQDHIRYANSDFSQTKPLSKLDRIRLKHEAFPELNFSEINIAAKVFDQPVGAPLFVSSMTAGHEDAFDINMRLALACTRKKWAMGVGSQRRELFDANASLEWRTLRKECPKLVVFGNVGLAQLLENGPEKILKLVESVEAQAMIVHTNPLQEALQPEGSRNFKGGLKALEKLVSFLPVPVIVKETGCGFSLETLQRLSSTGVAAVDLSGLGGTHWGRIEGARSDSGSALHQAAQTFADWGISTVDSLLSARELAPNFQVWASGGVRTGLDAAKFLALGAAMVGIAQPMMQAALLGDVALEKRMEQFELELKIAMFCTGSADIHSLRDENKWELV